MKKLYIFILATTLATAILYADSHTLAPEDYGCLWWAHGSPYYYDYRALPADNIPEDYPGKKQILCLHTGTYGMAIDTLNLDKINLGTFETPVSYEADIDRVDNAIFSLPESKLSIEVTANGKTYNCTGRQQPTDSKLFPVRFVEYGRFFQHVSINNLILKDNSGNTLDADCRLEITSWPGKLNITFYLQSKTVKPDRITLGAGAKSFDKILRTQDDSLAVILPLIDPGPSPTIKDVTVAPAKNTKIDATISETHGACIVKIRPPDWSNNSKTYYPEEHLDRLDKWPFTLTNDTDKTKTFRLIFDTPPRNITGFTPMILDEQGRPSGIPVQISKNWHRDKTPIQYQGSWIHGSTLIKVPPKSTHSCQYAIAYARWGGVPAASHAQLSLIGWGHNMFWDQCAIGSFGESICYEPGRTQRRSFITDVRPLMVLAKDGKKWGWTDNAGGGDFLVYFNADGKYVPMIKTRPRYYSYGPNLTKVTYDEISRDGAIKASYTVSIARADDYLRVFQNIRYDILKSLHFSRLAFCQMPADYYNDMKYAKTAIGNADGMISEWPTQTGNWKYDRKSIPMPGNQPWISLHDVVSDEKTTQAARGLIVRKWNARLGSKVSPTPHLSTYMTQWHKNNFRVAAELAPPPDLKTLNPGDYIDTDIELVVLPSKPGIYYGPNKPFIDELKQNANTWKMIHREAAGNNLNFRMQKGTLLKYYPIEISVDANQQAQFTVSGGIGYVPVTFAGLKDHTPPKLYRFSSGRFTPVDQSVNGSDFWQTDYDTNNKTWSITYNINLDPPTESPTPVTFTLR